MNVLNYGPVKPKATTREVCEQLAIVLLPLVAVAVNLLVAYKNAEDEPYIGFKMADAVCHIGAPAFTLMVFAVWLVLWIKTRRRRSPVLFVLVLPWWLFLLGISVWFGAGYFREPWNV